MIRREHCGSMKKLRRYQSKYLACLNQIIQYIYRPAHNRHGLKKMDHFHHYAVKRAAMERMHTKEIIFGTNQFVTDFYIAIILLELCGLIRTYKITLEIILTQCIFLYL